MLRRFSLLFMLGVFLLPEGLLAIETDDEAGLNLPQELKAELKANADQAYARLLVMSELEKESRFWSAQVRRLEAEREQLLHDLAKERQYAETLRNIQEAIDSLDIDDI